MIKYLLNTLILLVILPILSFMNLYYFTNNLIEWFILFIQTILLLTLSLKIGRLYWIGTYTKYFILIIFAIIAGISLNQVIKYSVIDYNIDYLKIIINILIVFVLTIYLYRTFIGSIIETKSINLGFPFKDGIFYTVDAGNSSLTNNHYNNEVQKYAVDFYKLNKYGFRCNGIYPKNLSKYYIYNEPLYSPVDGHIIKVIDGIEDLIPPKRDQISRAGNHIVIKIKNEEDKFLLLGHLKKGSISIKEGDEVKKGKMIARIGNTGRTEEPHLHIHCMQNMKEDYVLKGKGIPITFDGKFLIRNNIIKK